MNLEEKYLYYNELFDNYGVLLTDHEKDTFKLFYEEDLSLSEIAEVNKCSKSAVGKTIKTVEEKLVYYENKLNILEKKNKLKDIINNINDIKLKEELENFIEKS